MFNVRAEARTLQNFETDPLPHGDQLAPEPELAGVEEPDDVPDGDPDEAGFSLAAGLLSVVLFVSPVLDSLEDLPDPLDLEA